MRRKSCLSILVLGLPILVFAAVPRPEHPRPDAFRTNWLSLNGVWQFEVDSNADGQAHGFTSGQDLISRINVPFCPESKLSGLDWGNTNCFENAWYRRMVDLPDAMNGKRILLHFGGVDYKTWVFINGQLAGEHVGGTPSFSFEITRFVHAGENEFVVRIHDALRSGLQPGGKQSPVKSEGCNYTRTTGIWQPVWLEAVGSSYVEDFSLAPDPDHSRVLIEATVNGLDSGLELVVEAIAQGKLVGSATAKGTWRNKQLVLNLRGKKLWSPSSPFLYDLKFTLFCGKKKIDELQSYFGLRKVTVQGRRILINDKPIFQRLILDQGFYPDGIWTAPSDAALKHDIEMSMAAGYNGARLHQKVFEPRFLYWADKLGYLVWGEFPNWGFNYSPEGYAPFLTEWTEVVLRDRNHPAVIGWCPFNETGGRAEQLQQLLWKVTKAIDPTRPLLEASGYTHTLPNSEVLDSHDYESNPEKLRQRWTEYFNGTPTKPQLPRRYNGSLAPSGDCGVPFMISEIGGIGWDTVGGWGYGAAPKDFDEFYARYQGTLDALLDNPNLFGFCYTQLTDIEQEHNGLYYYDRRPKFDVKRLHAITSRLAAYERGEPTAPPPAPSTDHWTVLTGALTDGKLCTPWRYTTQAPTGEWTSADCDESGWAIGKTPFGQDEKGQVRTPWAANELYLRKSLQFDGAEIKSGAAVLFCSGPTEIFVNGQKICDLGARTGRYVMHDVSEALRKALRRGSNTLAVHVRQSTGTQFVDLALLYF